MKTAAACVFFCTLAATAHAVTFTVTTTDDSGAGSLRQAILDANGTNGLDTIAFDAGDETITPQTPLPTITDPVLIDGYTQDGAVENDDPEGNTAELVVEIDGSNAGAGANGLRVATNGCTIRGLAINNFSGAGIQLDGNSNVVAGSFIGLAANGFFGEPNTVGVYIGGASNVVGGLATAARNAIGANTTNVLIVGVAATGNTVQGNFIGTDASGVFGQSDSETGVHIDDAPGNVIGGSEEGARNVIAGNVTGVILTGSNSTSNRVEYNFIGPGPSGVLIPGNDVGVLVAGTAGNIIGASNTIAGNSVAGVRLNAGAAGNAVSNNLIGVVASDGVLFPEGNALGVEIVNAGSNVISGNVIAGNDSHGIAIGLGATNNWVQGNAIGVDSAAIQPDLGNDADGLFIRGVNTIVGGTEPGAGNLIAFNSGNGVTVSNGLHNTVLANSIYTNKLLGIDLAPAYGVTTNDLGDADAGANNRQNYPALTNASSCTGITIAGSLISAPNADFELEFFRNDGCDASGFGEGQTLIGWTNVTTDIDGNVAFSVTYTNDVATGEFITSTATDAVSGDTSEFSACLEVDRVLCQSVTRPADENCQAVVTPAELDGGTTDPCVGPVTITANPAGPYPKGTNNVLVVAIATGFSNSCLTQVIVVDQTPPVMIVPTELVRMAGPLTTNRVTFFDSPTVTDNCSTFTISCTPPSGSTFAVGTNTIACTATDSSGNSTNSSFPLIIRPFGTVEHDLAVVLMKAPKTITLRATRPTLTKPVTIQIQNRSAHTEIIPDFGTLSNLVSLAVESLGACADITPVLLTPKSFPINLASKRKLRVRFNVTFGCANDGSKGTADFSYTARVDHAAIDGEPDGHADDDYCPRNALPGGVDANPDGKIRDKGCGGRHPDRTLGAAVTTDVIIR